MDDTTPWNWKHYIYKGPVYDNFGNLIESNWYGQTSAYGTKRAISNLKHRYRVECNLPMCTKLTLDELYLRSEDYYKYLEDNMDHLEEAVEEEPSVLEQLRLF